MNTYLPGRRKRAMERLQHQLTLKLKNTKEGEEALTDKDIKRIEKEIGILKSCI